MSETGLTNTFSHVNRTLLFVPFMPFIVMFCHVVETQDDRDLERLRDFVESIEAAAHMSDAASKAHRLFLALHGIAVRYVAGLRAAAVSSSQGGDGEGHPEMDWFMTALGIPPLAGRDNAETQQHSSYPDAAAHAAVLEAGAGGGSSRSQQRLDTVPPPLVRMGNEAELESWLCENEDLMELLQ